jgi:hypothetical protein
MGAPVSPSARYPDAGFVNKGGEMGALIRAKDWSDNPLRPPETWTQSVKAAVSLCLTSRFPIILWLGPDLRVVYNDAYIPFLGETKHPAMLGAPGYTVWKEIWDTIGPMHDEVRAGRATWAEDLRMFFARRLPRDEIPCWTSSLKTVVPMRGRMPACSLQSRTRRASARAFGPP